MATEDEVASALKRSDVGRACGLLSRALERGARVAASCSATFLLGASGVLDGREATTTWWLGPSFSARFPRVILRTDLMVVAAGRVFTAGSSFGHADLMLALLAATTSPQLAHLVAQYLLLDERTSQARYMVADHLQSTDAVVRALEHFILANLGRQLSVEEMARATATSPRTLARKLAAALQVTPLAFARRIRVARALHLLETTREPVDQIAARVGYADAAAFRRIFRREIGQAPGERRKRRARHAP
jgi:transcriptional regulator GlxA family with amidase domain